MSAVVRRGPLGMSWCQLCQLTFGFDTSKDPCRTMASSGATDVGGRSSCEVLQRQGALLSSRFWPVLRHEQTLTSGCIRGWCICWRAGQDVCVGSDVILQNVEGRVLIHTLDYKSGRSTLYIIIYLNMTTILKEIQNAIIIPLYGWGTFALEK